MFGKLMSIPDTLIVKYLTLLTDVEEGRIASLEQQLKARAINPMDAKRDLATEIVRLYYDEATAQRAAAEFAKVFSRRESPSEMPQVKLRAGANGQVDLIELLVAERLAKTKNEARRLLRQGAVKLNGTVVKTPLVPAVQAAGILKVGSRHFRKLVRSES
jgi:tyrosyl-tRNA synthetase